jgi:hypothetical protein
MNDEEAEQAVYWALEAGYRHIDSAEWYVHTASYWRAAVHDVEFPGMRTKQPVAGESRNFSVGPCIRMRTEVDRC